MANYLYVDNSNVWIEGMRVAAVQRGKAPDLQASFDGGLFDHSWKIDFGRLFTLAGGDKVDVGRAVLFGTRPPPNDSLWDAAANQGFEVVVYDRNIRNKEKKVDTSIATEIMFDALTKLKVADDEITLVAGDADYVPTVAKLRQLGFRFDVVFWNHASRELREGATKFISLDKHLDLLDFNRLQK